MLVAAILLVPGGVADPGDRSPEHCAKLPDPPGRALGIEKHCPGAASSGGVARGDFNGDGFADLAIGVPDEDITVRGTTFFGSTAILANAGAVVVLYGSATGLVASGSGAVIPAQLWHQNSVDVLSVAESFDQFGASLAAGDFDGDDRSDLAVAVPSEDAGGAVHVLYGSDAGLTAADDQLLTGDAFGVPGDLAAPGYPLTLVWGNFDGDAFGDLAVGNAGGAVGSVQGAGRVHILYGTSSGLGTARRQTWSQVSQGVPNDPEIYDGFGYSLVAGDFDGNLADDLAVGVPFEDVTASRDGAVQVVYGLPGSGLSTTQKQADFWHRNLPGFDGENTEDDYFGFSLAAGDFNGDLRADLVVGAERTDVERPDGTVASDAGAVHVVYGSSTGLHLSATLPDQLWHQDSVDEGNAIEEAVEPSDRFGRALAAADFDGDGWEDLAVGSSEALGTRTGAGAVNVIYGSADEGLDAAADELFHQDSSGIRDEAETYDFFGAALSAWNFGNGAPADLAVGVPFEDFVTQAGIAVDDAGLVHVIYGTTGGGLDEDDDQVWSQDTDGVPDSAESDDNFGKVLY